MRTRTTRTGARYGTPSPTLIARADRGYRHFLTQAGAAEHGAGQEPELELELEATRDDATRPR